MRACGRALLRGSAVVLVLSCAYVASVLYLQRRLLYQPPSPPIAPARPHDAVQVWLPGTDGPVEAWHLPPVVSGASPTPLIVFFHGNAELIDFLPADFDAPRRLGVGVLLVEFPGYGRSSGSHSETAIAAVALAAYDWAHAEPGIDSRRIVAYGRSLGGGAATILATRRPTAALILESTFTSVRSFAHDFLVPEFAVLDPFDNLSALASYRSPVLVLHGERDEVIPLRHARELARSAPRADLHVLACGHNDCARPWTVVRRFLIESGVLDERSH